MYAVTRVIRILVVVVIVNYASCQDGFNEREQLQRDLLRLHQLSTNDGQVETITSYSANVIQRDPLRNDQINSMNMQYQINEDADKSGDYGLRSNQGRSDRKKVFRIKNPFQRQLDTNEGQEEDNTVVQDSSIGASNQYPSVQYSLPPEEFLEKMRAERDYLQQASTPSPMLSYTATPQPQYQYPTNPINNYDNRQQQNQMNQPEQKPQQQQTYNTNQNYYSNSYSYDNSASTPSPVPPYLSTANNQFVGTPASSYVSSASPVYVSSPQNVQQYVSSPLSVVQTGTPDYSNRVSTIASNTINYDHNEPSKRMQIDHYDNSVNGLRYPVNMQQNSYENPSSTPSPPSSSQYPDSVHDAWQNSLNSGSISKAIQEMALSQYQNNNNNQYNNNQQDARSDTIVDTPNIDTHRASNNLPGASNLYVDYMQPEYQNYNNLRNKPRDLEHEASQHGIYSHGDYGWKMNEKKLHTPTDGYNSGSVPMRYQTYGLHDGSALSQMNFYLDSGNKSPYDQISKSSIESQEAQEFAKAAARAQENMKQQQQFARLAESYFGQNHYSPNYAPNFQSPSPMPQTQPNIVSTFYGNSDRHRNNLFAESSNVNPTVYGSPQPQQDIVTVPSYYYSNQKENSMNKPKLPFDHAKALKNIVPIDVSNVIGNESPNKNSINQDNGNKFNIPNYAKEQFEQSLKQFYKPSSSSVADSYYKDKNSGYGFNIKSKTEDISSQSSDLKQYEQSVPYYLKQQDSSYNKEINSDKRYSENASPTPYLGQQNNNYQNNVPVTAVSGNIQKPQNTANDISNFLKLNDIPYRLTQGIPNDSYRLHNPNFDQGSIPTPLPTRINQNMGSHQIDVANNILKLMENKQPGLGRPEFDIQPTGPLSTINGFRVANPFNVDLKLVAEMLKGKSNLDDPQIIPVREQFNKHSPIKLDMSTLQQLIMKNNNYNNLASLAEGLTGIGSPYMDIYGSGHYPYQGVKYSRSQEEEENVPIAEPSNTNPIIGAVMEQGDLTDARDVNTDADVTSEVVAENYEDKRPKHAYNHDGKLSDHPKHPNSLIGGRHPHFRSYPKSSISQPYPLLKPPPPHQPSSKSHMSHSHSKRSRRRRVNRPRFSKVLKTEALFEADANPHDNDDNSIPTLFRPPAPHVEKKSDMDLKK